MPITKTELREIVDLLREELQVPLKEEARQVAQGIVYRVLEVEHEDLRNRVRGIIREVVKEEVGKHLDISVTWK